MRSLRRGLLQWTLGALAFGSMVLVLVAYVFMLDEMNEVLDDNLRQVAASVARSHAGAQAVAPHSETALPRPSVPDQADLVTRIWRRDGQPVNVPDNAAAFQFLPVAGPGRAMLDGVEWRTFTIVDSAYVVLAAQRTAARRQMAVEAASRLLLPLLLLALMIGGLLVVALRRGLHPLDEATAQIAQRSALTLEPIEGAEMPREIQPLVGAFNGLMGRLAAAFAMQRQFVADAAHELRSPSPPCVCRSACSNRRRTTRVERPRCRMCAMGSIGFSAWSNSCSSSRAPSLAQTTPARSRWTWTSWCATRCRSMRPPPRAGRSIWVRVPIRRRRCGRTLTNCGCC